jgi:hypothetical protein
MNHLGKPRIGVLCRRRLMEACEQISKGPQCGQVAPGHKQRDRSNFHFMRSQAA